MDRNSFGKIDCTALGKTDNIALLDGNALGSRNCDGWDLVLWATDGRTLGSFEGTKSGDGLG